VLGFERSMGNHVRLVCHSIPDGYALCMAPANFIGLQSLLDACTTSLPSSPRLPLNIVNPLTDNDATDQLDEINYTRAETKACGADPRFTKALVAAMSQRGTFSL